ncbi:MAG: DUF6114 domain-containing protein [Haloarculaceae archaeon]
MVTPRTLTAVGGLLLCLGGAVVALVPLFAVGNWVFVVGVQMWAVVALVAGVMLASGLAALARPPYDVEAGVAGLVASIASIAVLGGLLVGLVLGVLGGVLVVVGGLRARERAAGSTTAEP